jgi:hypothetical protein
MGGKESKETKNHDNVLNVLNLAASRYKRKGLKIL